MSAKRKIHPKKEAPKPTRAKKKKAKAPVEKFSWGVSEAQVVAKMEGDLLEAWEKLRAFAAGLGEQRIYASPLAIMFAKKHCYFFVRPKKSFLEVWIFLPRKIEGLTSSQSATKNVKYSNLFKLVHADQVETPLTDWIREAFGFVP